MAAVGLFWCGVRADAWWSATAGLQVEEHCCKLARKGLTPSQIGVILRDSHGIAQVGSVTGSKVLRILKGKGALPAVAAPCPRRSAIPIRVSSPSMHPHALLRAFLPPSVLRLTPVAPRL